VPLTRTSVARIADAKNYARAGAPAHFFLDFRPEHYSVFCSERRFKGVVAGRRWGKTTLVLQCLSHHAVSKPEQICYYIGRTEKQAKETAWRVLKNIVPPPLLRRVRESDLEIEFLNGSRIKLHGPQSLRGGGLDFAALDEYAYMPAELWPEIVRPMLADREGRAILSSTPRGMNHFYDLYEQAVLMPDWAFFQFPTAMGGYIRPEESDLLRSTMDPRLYAQEIEASFVLQAGRVYHQFSRDLDVHDVPLIPGPPLLIGMDFNVDPMTAVVCQKVGGQCRVSAEIVLPNSNTFEMMAELLRRYPGQTGVVHPDPSGSARKTSAPVGQTDHNIIRQAGWAVHALKQYPVVDRINSVNAMFRNVKGERRIVIDRKCTRLVRALEGLTYKEGTNLPDNSSELVHITDALGYLIMGVFPMLRDEVGIWKVSL
jgi:hypothetical protein